MTDPRLDGLRPRPPASAGWIQLRDWLRDRNALLRVPRWRYEGERIPEPSSCPGCASCADLVSVELGDFCGVCGAPIPTERLATPEAGRDPAAELELFHRNPEA